MSNVDVVRRVYQAFAQGDLATVMAATVDDFLWEEPDSVPYGSHTGWDAILAHVLQPVMQEFEGFGSAPEEWVDGGDLVVVLGRYHGTARATGRQLDTPSVHVWRLRDGKVTAFRTSYDSHHWLEVLGAVGTTPAPASA